jgi:hypothetical protein
MDPLADLWTEARRAGSTASRGDLFDVRRQAAGLGWIQVPLRKGESGTVTLRPLSPEAAPRSSLSALYGRGAQPLHTDGAHLMRPPDVVVLCAQAASKVATKLWSLTSAPLGAAPTDAMLHGVFTVTDGQRGFLATAFADGRIRFDPGCMVANDQRARETATFFANAITDARDHHWEAAGSLLVLDNRRTLHAREDAHQEPERALDRVAFLLPEGNG